MQRDLLHILFPTVRAEILRLLFTLPNKQRYVRELMNMSGLALRTIQEELEKLEAAGLITSWSNGYHRFYEANGSHPLVSDLRRIVRESERLPGVEQIRRRRPRSRKKRKRNIGKMPLDRPQWHLYSRKRHNLTG